MTGNPTPEETAAVLAALLAATTASPTAVSTAPRPPEAYARWRARRIAMITPRHD